MSASSEDAPRRIDPDSVSVLTKVIGQCLSRIEQLHYCIGAELLSRDDLQLTFDNGVIRMRVGANGQSLKIVDDAWVDSFGNDLSEIDIEYISTHGRYKCIDISPEPEYVDLLGQTLRGVAYRVEPPDQITGATLRFDTKTFHVHVEFDELLVSWAKFMPPLGDDE